MQCPGCANSPIVGAVPDANGSGQYVTCPLCGQYGTPGQYPGAGKGYFYQINISLTDQNQHPITVQIRAQADFLWKFAIASRVGTFTTIMDLNGAQMQTVFNSAGQILPTTGINDTNLWGTNQNPFPLPDPIALPAQGRLTFTLTDTSGANGGAPNNIALFLVGANFDPGSIYTPFQGGSGGN